MELELLKEIWNNATDKPVASIKLYDSTLMVPVVSQRTIVATMKRNLFIELIVVAVCVTTIALFYFIAFDGRLKEVSWMYIILAGIFGVYFYKKNKLLREMECTSCRVKSNLELQLKTLEKYVRLYLVTGTLMVPVILLFFYLLVYYKHIVFLPSLYAYARMANFTLIYSAFAVIFTVVLYFVYRWYINRLYGKYIDRLKSMLSEMNDES
ncbi:MAG: hypothetical protein QM802_17910 [Agriterribacter sp.]